MPEGVGYGPQFTASVGLNLNVIGDYAYGYSGSFIAETSTRTRLKFTTGAYLFVGKVRLSGMIDLTTAASGAQATMTVKMNDVIVLIAKTDGSEEDMPSADKVPIIIPPYTEVEVLQDSSSGTSSNVGTVSITGRVYK